MQKAYILDPYQYSTKITIPSDAFKYANRLLILFVDEAITKMFAVAKNFLMRYDWHILPFLISPRRGYLCV